MLSPTGTNIMAPNCTLDPLWLSSVIFCEIRGSLLMATCALVGFSTSAPARRCPLASTVFIVYEVSLPKRSGSESPTRLADKSARAASSVPGVNGRVRTNPGVPSRSSSNWVGAMRPALWPVASATSLPGLRATTQFSDPSKNDSGSST